MASKTQHNVLLLLFALAMAVRSPQVLAQTLDYPTLQMPFQLTNGPNIPHTITYPDGTTIKALLLRRDPSRPLGPSFAAGFYCKSSNPFGPPCRSNFLFGVFLVTTNSAGGITINNGIPQLVWSANKGSPVGENAILELTTTGGLILKDADGTEVWNAGNSGQDSLNKITELSLFTDGSLRVNGINWSSFNSYADVLLPGQKLIVRTALAANLSAANYWQSGNFKISTTLTGFVASDGTRNYYEFVTSPTPFTGTFGYMLFTDGSFSFVQNEVVAGSINLPRGSPQFLRIEYDGQLRHYQWNNGWKSTDLISLVASI